MSNTYKEAVTTVTLNDGESLSGQADYLTLNAAQADFLRVVVDDGAGNDPAAHDLTVEADKDAVTGYLQVGEQTGTTARVFEIDAPGDNLRIDLTNQSGATTASDFRIYAEAVKLYAQPESTALYD